MSKFIFIRHGESEANAAGEIATPRTKLTKLGIEQATKTAAKLEGLGVTKIACSPMVRAQQTAEIIAGELGIDVKQIVVVPELEERRFGNHEGKPKMNITEWYYTSNEEPTSEKTSALLARMQRCLKKLKKLTQNEKLLVVGHGSSGFYLIQAAKGKTVVNKFDPPSQMSNADFIEVEV